MKKLFQFGVTLVLLLFLLVGCQNAKSTEQKEDSTNKVEAASKTMDKETATDENEQVEETEEKVKEDEAAVEEEGTEDKEEEQIVNLEEQTVDGITLKILDIQEYIPETIQASNDRFVSIKMEIKNEKEESVELSSLRHFSLLVDNQPQDLAYIEEVSELATEVPAGETVTKQIVYDCVNADEYQFVFQLTEDQPVSWTFSLDTKETGETEEE